MSLDAYKDFVIPACISTVVHPLTFSRSLMILGYEPLPPKEYSPTLTLIFGSKKYLCYPNIFKYLAKLKEDHGLFVLFTAGLPSAYLSSIMKSYITEETLKKLVPDYHTKKTFIDTEHGVKVCVRETGKLMGARVLGVVISYPLQVIMLRQIADAVATGDVYPNILGSIGKMITNEGPLSLFDGLVPRVISEVITVITTASLAYMFNNYVFPPEADQSGKEYTPMIASLAVSSLTHPFTVVSFSMAIAGAGLTLSNGHTSSWSCFKDLYTRNALKRGSGLFFRYALEGPM